MNHKIERLKPLLIREMERCRETLEWILSDTERTNAFFEQISWNTYGIGGRVPVNEDKTILVSVEFTTVDNKPKPKG